jgi:cysteine desulfurase
MQRIYLDHNATSPMRPEAIAAFTAGLGQSVNASSVHYEGRAARQKIEASRQVLAELLQCKPQELVFTSGGSEACNQAIKAWDVSTRPFQRILLSAIEHDAVIKAAENAGLPIDTIAVDEHGLVSIEDLRRKLDEPSSALVCVMAANNETGVIQPMAEIAALVRAHGSLLFCDASQAVGKMPISFRDIGADMMAVSAHKFGGALGAGALLVKQGLSLGALIDGGGQEGRKRSGTENLPAIAAMVAALQAAVQGLEAFASLAAERDRLEQCLVSLNPDLVVFGKGAPRLPNTSCFAVPSSRAETLVMGLDLAGVSVSSGAACSSGKVGTSHVMRAMGVASNVASGALRISFGWSSQAAHEVDAFIKIWRNQMSGARPSAAE